MQFRFPYFGGANHLCGLTSRSRGAPLDVRRRTPFPKSRETTWQPMGRRRRASRSTSPRFRLEKTIAPYAGEKGNLRFPLDQPIPYGLIERIVRLRVKQNLAKAARPYSASALIGRLMSERTASRAGRCWYSTRYAI